MEKKFSPVYIPVGVPTFHLESAHKEFEKSISMLKDLSSNVVVPDKMLLKIEDLVEYLDSVEPDLIILQNITFANAAYAYEVLKRFDAPLVLWTLREPVIDGTRLRLNSLTGAYSAGNAIKEIREDFEYVFGAPDEEDVISTISAYIRAAEVKHSLKN